MASKPQPITVKEWLDELLRAERVDAAGFTRQDVEQALGWTEQTAGEWLRRWGQAGLIRHVGYVMRYRIDGRPFKRPCYQVVKNGRLTRKGRGVK